MSAARKGYPPPRSMLMHYYAVSYTWTDRVQNVASAHHVLVGCESAARIYEKAEAEGYLITSVSEISAVAYKQYESRGILKVW